MDRNHQSRVPPPSPWDSAGHPMQNADQSCLGQDAFKDADLLASELAIQMQQRQHFRKQFQKTQFCRYHLSMGGCRKGTSCEFAHDAEELTRAPDLRRTSICKDWQEGKCQATAETCKFAHGNAMLRRTLADATVSGCRSMMAPAESSSASGFGGMRGGFSSASRLFTNWEQQLLSQQVEQGKLKETIREQQKTIDSLMRLQLVTAANAAPGPNPVLPQSGNHVQPSIEHLQQTQDQQQMTIDALMRLQIPAQATSGQHPVFPQSGNHIQSSIEHFHQTKNILLQSSQQANCQSYSSDSRLAVQLSSPGIPF